MSEKTPGRYRTTEFPDNSIPYWEQLNRDNTESICKRLLEERDSYLTYIESHGPHSRQGMVYRKFVQQSEDALVNLVKQSLLNESEIKVFEGIRDRLCNTNPWYSESRLAIELIHNAEIMKENRFKLPFDFRISLSLKDKADEIFTPKEHFKLIFKSQDKD